MLILSRGSRHLPSLYLVLRFQRKAQVHDMFYRQKKIDCGDQYSEVDIIPRSLAAELNAKKGQRSKKRRVSEPKQKNLNDKNAKRYLLQLGNGNFGAGDLHVSCTYRDEFLPRTVAQAEKEARNFLRRLEYRRQKQGLPDLKYILVTECQQDDEGKYIKRVHHHIVMNGGLDRDEVESIWSKRVKGQGKQSIGWINADRIQPNKNGVEALMRYISKDPKGKKRWSSSRNLKRPVSRNNDSLWTQHKVKQMAANRRDAWLQLEKIYPRYQIAEVKFQHNELTGWHVYLKMWLKPEYVKNRR
ncbi:SMI1/KNR4 family protein [Loigolactobacillus bifermentans]|nr:SMI1/KNR4 family protein [Loigolactobacillus bifermentans]